MAALILVACGSSAEDGDGDPSPRTGAYETCPAEARRGEFLIASRPEADPEPFTSVERALWLDGVETLTARKEIFRSGPCRITQPLGDTCRGSCDLVTQQCAAGRCERKPSPQNLGTVTLTGFGKPLALDNVDHTYFGSLTYPGAPEGTAVSLSASGAGAIPTFTVRAQGIAPLSVEARSFPAERGKATTLHWKAPARPASSRMVIDFSVNLHGAVETLLTCEVPDSGAFTIGADVMTELFKHDTSGFPRVTLTRQSAGAATVAPGCAELVVYSSVDRDLNVPGLVSCKEDGDCPAGKTCHPHLYCR
jgi:hypothetical protein